MTGCKQVQELGVLTVNIQEIIGNDLRKDETHKPPQKGKLTEELVLEEFADCFDKVGRFPGDKYHITLQENAIPVIHPPRTVPVHILPLYKQELEKMVADDVITGVNRDFKIPQQSTTEDELKCAAKHAEEWVDYDKNGAKCVSFKPLRFRLRSGLQHHGTCLYFFG